MKKCPFCGTELNDDSLFCTECGKQLPKDNQCPHCGASVNDGDAFCTKCGKPLGELASLPKQSLNIILKKCPNGHEVSDKMKFCPECGAEVKEGSKKICKKCGNEQKDGEKFCFQCGTPFVEDSLIPRTKVFSKLKMTIIASLIALFVIVVGCCLWYFNGNKYGRYSLEGLAKVTYKYDFCGEFHEGMAMVHKGDKIGYIDRMGNEVIPCIYDEIIPSRDDEVLNWNNFYFHDGLALVCKDDKYFFINKKGEKAFPFKYDLARDFSEGLAVVYKDGKYGFIDTKGNEVIPLTDKVYGGFSEGLSVVQKGNKYGYIDKSGKIVIPMQFETDEYGYGACPFMNGLAVIRKNGKKGYIDKNGKEVIPCIYENASNFSEGLALVRNGESRAGYIDKKGNEVIPCIYHFANDFSDGLALVSKEEVGKEFFINNKGEKVFSCSDYIGDGFQEGYAPVGRGNNCGFVDKHGKEFVPRIYQQVLGFSEGLAAVRKDDIWGYIDTKGKSTFDVISEETKAIIKEEQRIEQEKREEERRRFEEENKPMNRFFKIAQTDDYAWKCFEYQGFDFCMLYNNTDEVLLYFKPVSNGGGSAFYVSHRLGKNHSWYTGYSGFGQYTVSENFLTMTIRSIYRDSSGSGWPDKHFKFLMENDGDKVKLIRIFNPPRRVMNTDYNYINIDRVDYVQIRKPMDNPFNRYSIY